MFAGVDHIVAVGPEGQPELTWVPPRSRVRWLIWTMVTFGNSSRIAEALIAGPDARGLDQSGCWTRLSELLEDRFLEGYGRE